MRLSIAAALAVMLATPAAAEMKIAITFDDLPSHAALPAGTTRVEIAQQIIAGLKAANAGKHCSDTRIGYGGSASVRTVNSWPAVGWIKVSVSGM